MTPPGALPRWQRQLPLGTVLLVVAGLVILTVAASPGGYRIGLCVVAGALVLAGLLRAVLTPRRIGLLAVRSRPFDVLLLTATAAGIVVLALSLPPGS